MTTLYATKVWCSEETNESGSDDPYLVVFVGRPAPAQPFVVSVGPEPNWDSMGTGDKRNWWTKLYQNYSPANLHLVTMMEEDWGKDVAGQARTEVEKWVGGQYKQFRSKIPNASNQDLANLLIPEMKKAIDAHAPNDERLSTLYVNLGNQSSKWAKFTGDGGTYWVEFTTGGP